MSKTKHMLLKDNCNYISKQYCWQKGVWKLKLNQKQNLSYHPKVTGWLNILPPARQDIPTYFNIMAAGARTSYIDGGLASLKSQ